MVHALQLFTKIKPLVSHLPPTMAVLVVARTTNDRATVVVAVIVKIVDNRALVV